MTYNSLRLEVSCPNCAHERFTVIATSKVGGINTRSASVIQCAKCAREWSVSATLARADNTARPVDENNRGGDIDTKHDRCGSNNGYHDHLRAKEPTCQPCRDAHTQHRRNRKTQRKQAA